MRYNIYIFFIKLSSSKNILKHLKLFYQIFLYLYQNNFISKSNQIHSKYLYSCYQITNGAQLGKLHKSVTSFKFVPFKVNKTKSKQL